MRTVKVDNIRYQNGQKYSECQLVTALNASYKLGESFIDPKSNEYERLVDLVLARNGGAITVENAYDYLRLIYVDVKPSWESIVFADYMNLPLDITIMSPKYGVHSVAIVGVKYGYRGRDGFGEYVIVPNMAFHTNKSMLIKREKLEKHIKISDNIAPAYGFFRMFIKNPLFH